ncbi:hypothetical protein MUO14_17260 [Halobacillus shinanisalinarum]|uniref:Uncharacterized protein n=1 Tax=Halobacillus shinanisalinarum TaxID=2932258 RepID=A0ABY4GWD2_9BACI|nr:hypothetical protein [Halobacillus shinanisalinarum]UOQ92220.1 hypothetical protein MUO14_17260 [Halobacillus shinanisalinarum]
MKPIQEEMTSALRQWKPLSGKDADYLKEQIEATDAEGRLSENYLSSEEVFQLLERDIEKFLHNNPTVLGENFDIVDQQRILGNDSRLDLLLSNKHTREYIVVEIKKRAFGQRYHKPDTTLHTVLEKTIP